MNERPTYIGGSGNIYADLGFEDPEMELMRDRLARRLGEEIQARNLTERDAGALLATDEATIVAILDGDLTDVSVPSLLMFLTRVGQDVKITVVPTSAGTSTGRLEVDAQMAVAGQSAVRPPST